MKKVILLLVVMFGMVSCNNSEKNKQAKLDLLKTASELSSNSYQVEMIRYMVNNKTDSIGYEALDSIKNISDKKCDSILSYGFEKVYK